MTMPKKKIQHKGKPKHATEESEGVVTPRESIEEEYTTVVDLENNKKYSKRLIQSNWSKYEAMLPEFDQRNEIDEQLKTDDFNYLLKTASSDFSHFQFNSEKLWKSENNSVLASKIFNLDLNVLSSGLACVPFYERMGIDEKELSVEDKERFDKETENSWKQYALIRDKLVNKLEDSEVMTIKSDEHSLDKSLKLELTLNSDKSEKQINAAVGKGKTDANVKVEDNCKNEKGDIEIGKNKKNIFFSENEENLEDWLDSVLDD